MNQRKVRRDAWESGLSEEHREKLYAAIAPLDYREGCALAAAEPFSLPPPSIAAYYRANARARAAVARSRALASFDLAARLAPEIRRHARKALCDDEIADTFASLAATAALEGAGGETVRGLADIAFKARGAALRARALRAGEGQLKLAREKFEAAERRLADVRGAVDAPQLSDAERVAKIKTIFGMK